MEVRFGPEDECHMPCDPFETAALAVCGEAMMLQLKVKEERQTTSHSLNLAVPDHGPPPLRCSRRCHGLVPAQNSFNRLKMHFREARAEPTGLQHSACPMDVLETAATPSDAAGAERRVQCCCGLVRADQH